jgi:hypothetical protein
VANLWLHETTREQPVRHFQRERLLLYTLPEILFDTDKIVPAVVIPHARIEFDGNSYLAPLHLVHQMVIIRTDGHEMHILYAGQVVARHVH